MSDLDAVLRTDVRHPIPPSTLSPILSSPPFIQAPLLNGRDMGLLPSSEIPHSRIYRSGALTPSSAPWLSSHVKLVLDLRRKDERAAHPDPDVPGVRNLWLDTEGDYPSPSVSRFAEGDGTQAWREVLLQVVRTHRPAFRAALEHLRDQPGVPWLFHCTAGRDRTGVLAGLLHHLAGTPEGTVEGDYMLSRAGIEPARDQLMGYVMESVGVGDLDDPGVLNLVSLRAEYWAAFLDGLGEEFGGWDGYVVGHLGFSEEDLAVIKRNIRGVN